MIGRPQTDEAAPYYWTYINQAPGDDPLQLLIQQVDEAAQFFASIPDKKSLHRYAPGKWSIREVLNHINDSERVFAMRAMWFARGYELPLPSFDQSIAIGAAHADQVEWAQHIGEFRHIRASTIALFRNLPADAWSRSGIASDCRFTVRALAFIIAGHVNHHAGILRTRYLPDSM